MGSGVSDVTECYVYWGSHGCGRPRGHDGDHECVGELGCDHVVSNSGYDQAGFRWGLYGSDSPEELADLLTLIYEAGNMLPGGRVPGE